MTCNYSLSLRVIFGVVGYFLGKKAMLVKKCRLMVIFFRTFNSTNSPNYNITTLKMS